MNAVISSRTPEGEPSRCPICGARDRVDPCRPPGDATCPSCGHLLWFPEPLTVGRRSLRTTRKRAESLLRTEPRRPMFGVVATLARQVRRVIRAVRSRPPAHTPSGASGVYDRWLDG